MLVYRRITLTVFWLIEMQRDIIENCQACCGQIKSILVESAFNLLTVSSEISKISTCRSHKVIARNGSLITQIRFLFYFGFNHQKNGVEYHLKEKKVCMSVK